MPKFAANLSMQFTDLPFLDRFKAAANAGFSAVEYLFPYDYSASLLADTLQQHNLKQVLFNTTPGNTEAGEWGLCALPGRSAEAQQNIDSALHYARILGCPAVHIMAGVVPEGADTQAYQQTFIANVQQAADKFAPYGIKIMLEALSPKVKPGYLMASQYQTLDLLKQIAKPNVFIQLDFFHAQIVDGNLTQVINDLAGYIGHIQIASVPARHEPDEGEVNYNYIFSELDRIKYEGWVGCEYNPRAKTQDGLGWLAPWLANN